MVLDPLRSAAAAHEPDDLDHLVGALAARPHVGVGPRELLGDPAEPDAEPDAVVATATAIDDSCFATSSGSRIGELDDVGEEADPLGDRGHRADRDERVDERRVARPRSGAPSAEYG